MRPLPAWSISHSPGNGTHYDLVLTEDPGGGLIVAWIAARFVGRLYSSDSLWSCPIGKLGKADDRAIRAILAELGPHDGQVQGYRGRPVPA